MRGATVLQPGPAALPAAGAPPAANTAPAASTTPAVPAAGAACTSNTVSTASAFSTAVPSAGGRAPPTAQPLCSFSLLATAATAARRRWAPLIPAAADAAPAADGTAAAPYTGRAAAAASNRSASTHSSCLWALSTAATAPTACLPAAQTATRGGECSHVCPSPPRLTRRAAADARVALCRSPTAFLLLSL